MNSYCNTQSQNLCIFSLKLSFFLNIFIQTMHVPSPNNNNKKKNKSLSNVKKNLYVVVIYKKNNEIFFFLIQIRFTSNSKLKRQIEVASGDNLFSNIPYKNSSVFLNGTNIHIPRSFDLPSLKRDQHLLFLKKGLQHLSNSYEVGDVVVVNYQQCT